MKPLEKKTQGMCGNIVKNANIEMEKHKKIGGDSIFKKKWLKHWGNK